jgi:hypothetical protein
MNDELEKLLKQKRDLERKIRDIKLGNTFSTDNIKFIHKTNSEDEDDNDFPWQVGALMKQRHRRYCKNDDGDYIPYIDRIVDRWQVFIRERSKEECLEKAYAIINDLKSICEKLQSYKEEEKNGNS